jgi:6-phosphogluconolactonase
MKNGAGPRHLAAHPTLPVIYVVNELSSTVVALRQKNAVGDGGENGEGDGILELLECDGGGDVGDGYLSTLSDGDPRAGNDSKTAAAAIRVHPSGKFLYCSNRVFASGGLG